MPAGERLWAVGDITGRGAFTHVAIHHAGITVHDVLGQPGPAGRLPGAVAGDLHRPGDRRVGLTQAQARANRLRVHVGVTRAPSTVRGWIHKAGHNGFIRLVADADRGVLVGATSAGPPAGRCWARWLSRCTARFRSTGDGT
jgi:pyruvate/2-oxoglutarate dehydrogenase complex dihydrolipoamide dehydrogenase (E3) component